ncbi:MAG: hypothetical protein Q9220_003464 [cf. Caloplaca sp. 1 TL-2023]
MPPRINIKNDHSGCPETQYGPYRSPYTTDIGKTGTSGARGLARTKTKEGKEEVGDDSLFDDSVICHRSEIEVEKLLFAQPRKIETGKGLRKRGSKRGVGILRIPARAEDE